MKPLAPYTAIECELFPFGVVPTIVRDVPSTMPMTGVSGQVGEPFLTLCPRPNYVLPAYANGRNLAESFYLGIMGLSWQNIVIGDPLCKLRQ